MGAPIIILGGILGGFFTPTEAAGIGALYMLLLALSYRTMRLRDVALIFRDTAVITGQIMIIIGASALLSWILAREQVPQTVAESAAGPDGQPARLPADRERAAARLRDDPRADVGAADHHADPAAGCGASSASTRSSSGRSSSST